MPRCLGMKGRVFCSGSRPSRPKTCEAQQPFAMPVQWVNRPNLDFRGFSGRIASGSVKPGDSVRISPSGVASRVKEIVVWGGSKAEATAGQSVTLVLEDEVDASRG